MDGMTHINFDGSEAAIVTSYPPTGVAETVRGVTISRDRDAKLSLSGRALMTESYLLPGESFQDRFATVAAAYGDDAAHAQRIYDYISKLWFMPATPVLSNGGTDRGLPISCFLNEANDDLSSIVDLWNENIWLAAKGGGIGSYWGNLRSLGERVGKNGKTSGIIPFIRVQDSLTLAISQGSLRRGSAAIYLPVSHPEIEEFIDVRRPTGGDPNRKALNLHNAVVIPDEFMHAVEQDADWALRSPKDNAIVRHIKARDLWIRILVARIETGEPYMLFSDAMERAVPEHHRLSGLIPKMSNLCAEITLPTGRDHHGIRRTAVCCLSSLNLDLWDEWKDHPTLVEDVMRFLDNVLDDFIARAPSVKRDTEQRFLAPLFEELRGVLGAGEALEASIAALRKASDRHFSGLMDSAIYSAQRERSVGLGVMGFHSFLQSKGIPLESAVARVWNRRMFAQISQQADAASVKLAHEKGACPDAAEHGIMERFSYKMAIAPTASISSICGSVSPGIEPQMANVFNEKRLVGSFLMQNEYLRAVLEKYGRNDADTWTSISVRKGSVQHLEFLTEGERATFRTAFELDQRALIMLAAERVKYISQAQSLNIFLPADVQKRDLHEIHNMAWAMGLKSLYYCRSLSMQRAQDVSDNTGGANALAAATFGGKRHDLSIAPADVDDQDKYSVCESCQ